MRNSPILTLEGPIIVQTIVGTITHTRAQASTVPASTVLASDSAPGHQIGTSKGLMIVGSVVGSVVAAYLVIWLVLRWARRRAGKPLSEGPIYRPLVQVKIPYEPIDSKYQTSFTFSPLKEMDITSRDQDPFASSGYSGADLPGYLFVSRTTRFKICTRRMQSSQYSRHRQAVSISSLRR